MSILSTSYSKPSGDDTASVTSNDSVSELRKKFKVSAVAKSVYRYFLLTFAKSTFDTGRMDAGVLPTFSSKWTKDQCSSMTFTFHNILGCIVSNHGDLVDDSDNICVKFEIVDIFAGLAGNEHVWNMFTFANSAQKYSIDLSIEQYDVLNVTNPVLNPWSLFLNVENKVFPLNLANKQKISNPEPHKVMFTNPCTVSDVTSEIYQLFLTELDDAALSGFVFVDKEAEKSAAKMVTKSNNNKGKGNKQSTTGPGARAVYTNVTAGECVMLRTALVAVKSHLKIV